MPRKWCWNKKPSCFWPLICSALSVFLLLGCGSGKGSNSVAQYYGDYHPTGWINAHGGQAVQGVDACTKCHENGRWKPMDAKCQSCHTKNFLEKHK